jgi:pilus assembly protein CpaC
VHQVLLKVTVAEVNRSAARAIGAELALGGDDVNFFSLLPVAIPGTGGNFFVNSGDFSLAINALKNLNLARSLAEPNLVTLNGQPANFQVGGQFPVPVVTGATNTGLQGVEFVPFGVQLRFVPTVTDKNRIRLQLQAVVSTRDESVGTTIGDNTNVAGLNTRNFLTTVELREGQTLAIAGLIQNNFGGTSNRVPLVGDVPILGRLFSSDNNSYDEQELIVLVTPHLVGPLAEGTALPLPGSDLFEPDDLEFFLGGRMTGGRAEDYRTPVRTDLEKMKAFRRAHRNYIIGQSGYSDGR